jgi:hypothetical protein
MDALSIPSVELWWHFDLMQGDGQFFIQDGKESCTFSGLLLQELGAQKLKTAKFNQARHRVLETVAEEMFHAHVARTDPLIHEITVAAISRFGGPFSTCGRMMYRHDPGEMAAKQFAQEFAQCAPN